MCPSDRISDNPADNSKNCVFLTLIFDIKNKIVLGLKLIAARIPSFKHWNN